MIRTLVIEIELFAMKTTRRAFARRLRRSAMLGRGRPVLPCFPRREMTLHNVRLQGLLPAAPISPRPRINRPANGKRTRTIPIGRTVYPRPGRNWRCWRKSLHDKREIDDKLDGVAISAQICARHSNSSTPQRTTATQNCRLLKYKS